jgi:hypothetical protein
MADDDKPALDARQPRQPRWWDYAWMQTVFAVVLVVLIALPIYTSVPRLWAGIVRVIWTVILRPWRLKSLRASGSGEKAKRSSVAQSRRD